MASMKDIKVRIKSVESTMQITKAMELVASSKLRKAKENAQKAQPYFLTLYKTLTDIAANNTDLSSVYLNQNDNATKKSAYILVAGDRGLAGGYNNNMFKLFAAHHSTKDCCVIPVGKKALDFCKRRNLEIVTELYSVVEDTTNESCLAIADIVCDLFKSGKVDKVYLGYTNFVSMLAQEPMMMDILPINKIQTEETTKKIGVPVYEPSGEELFDLIVPQYVSGLVYGGVTQSWASEQGARRTAMDSASKNAKEMVSSLSLQYNRARQAAITQEITEIVSGAGAQE